MSSKVPCDLCGVSYALTYLAKHKKSHAELFQNSSWKCDPCNLGFSEHSHLKAHHKLKHPASELIPQSSGVTKRPRLEHLLQEVHPAIQSAGGESSKRSPELSLGDENVEMAEESHHSEKDPAVLFEEVPEMAGEVHQSEKDLEEEDPVEMVEFTIGGEKFSIPAAEFSSMNLEEYYRLMGFEEDVKEGPPEEESVPEPPGSNSLFPNMESFLFYLLYQQEGANRIFQNKLELILMLCHDTRLDPRKFPRISALKAIDEKMKKASFNSLRTVLCDKLISKPSKKATLPAGAKSKAKTKGKGKAQAQGKAKSKGKGKAREQDQDQEPGQEQEQEREREQEQDLDSEEDSGEEEGSIQDNRQDQVSTGKIKVECFSIEGRLRMALSDPVVSDSLLFTAEEPKDGVVKEFVHTPFAQNPNKFARFLHWGDLKVHDIVEARDHTLGRIRGFRYLFDEIRMSLFPAAVLELLQPNEKGELVLFPSMTSTVFTTELTLCTKKICYIQDEQQIPFNEEDEQKNLDVLHKWYNPHTRAWIYIFYDKFVKNPTRYNSTGGLYMGILNQSVSMQKRLSNIHLLALVPNEADFVAVWETYRLEIIRLEANPFTYIDPKTKKEAQMVIGLGLFKADSPQRCMNLDHQGVTADNCCPRCGAKRKDIWDESFKCADCHHRVGLIESVIELKAVLTPKEFDLLKKNLGFHGEYAMFRGINYDPFLQTACEPYHLLFLGVLRFFMKRVFKALKPDVRGMVQLLIRDFPFPRGMYKIYFDVTSTYKNFSMSLMQQVSCALPYVLHALSVDPKITTFWATLDDLVQTLFSKDPTPERLPEIRAGFKRVIASSKALFPDITRKHPQNIHNLLEFLQIDLGIWVNVQVMSGTKEEQKHQVFKFGSRSTNPTNSENQLVHRDHCVSALRFLLHGGSLGDLQLPPGFKDIVHPLNQFRLHPLIESLLPKSRSLGTYPRKFQWVRGAKLSEGVDIGAQNLLHSEKAFPSEQFVVDGTVFAVGDCISVVGNQRNARWFLEITKILSDLAGNVIFRGRWFEFAKKTKYSKELYKRGVESPWQLPGVVVAPALIHHCCNSECNYHTTCGGHPKGCPPNCEQAVLHPVHSKTEEYFIEGNFRSLAS